MSRKTILLYILILSISPVRGQDCRPNYLLAPVKTANSIEWEKFPEFSLPFTIIYNGPRFGDQESRPLKHGFSHIAAFSGNEGNSLPVKNRALLWNSVGTIDDSQPWSNLAIRSPWGNDTVRYRNNWDNYLNLLANSFDDSRGSGIPRADIICMDVERMLLTDRDILRLKSERLVPAQYLGLPDQDFLATYKKDLRWWYAEAVRHLRKKGFDPNSRISSYSDIPVRNTWLNITSNSWSDWTTNKDRTHYLLHDQRGSVGGELYDGLNFIAPSPYYYYPYENPLGKDYLAYLLFQIEVNKAWSNKPSIPFVWMRYHDQFVANSPMISTFMAEATAIFPFFSGADGLWLWDSNSFESRNENYAAYEYFIYGLYRLSAFADFFRGDHRLIIEKPARDYMETNLPIWRGVAKGNRILIAAQNPHAADDQSTQLMVSHDNWKRVITLKGKEIFLCDFNLDESKSSIEELMVYPNPAETNLKIEMMLSGKDGNITYSLFDMKGALVADGHFIAAAGLSRHLLALPKLPGGLYIARFTSDGNVISKKVVVR